MAGIIGDIKAAAKKNVVKGISKSLFGKGIVGGALGKAFEKKFGDQEEKDTQVADALSEQGNLQDSNNATLARLESVVMNIADNIYNIAGVMNAQVVSMKEAQRLQSERAFKDAAAKEEADAEARKVDGPGAAGTEGTTGSAGGSKSLLGNILGSLGNTKILFKGFLKKFAVVAGALAIGAGTAYALSSSSSGSEQAPESQTASPQSDSQPETIPPESATTIAPPPDESPSSAFTNVIATQGGERGKKEAPLIGNIMGAMESGDMGAMIGAVQEHQKAFPQPPAATKAAPPPPAAATAPPADTTQDQDVAKLADYFNRPENAADNAQLEELQNRIGIIKRAIRDTKSLIASASTPEEKAKHEKILKDQLEPGLEATKKQKKAILDKARDTLGIKPTTVSNSGSDSGSSSMSPSSGGSSSPSVAAAPVPPSPSSGSQLNSQSVETAAAYESPNQNSNNMSVTNNSGDAGSPSPNSIPSPIANRGSLDADTVYSST